MTRFEPSLHDLANFADRPHAVVIGAGLGGLASAMRLGAKGYRVSVFDRLDGPGGRGSALVENGHRFDLGPTIVTAPHLFEELWKTCGRDFNADVELRPLDTFYEIRWPDGSRFPVSQDTQAMRRQIARLSPNDVAGYDRFLRESAARYTYGFEVLGRQSMHKLSDLLRALPVFVRLRADRSVYAHVARCFRDPRLRMAFSFHPLFIGGDPFNVTSIYTLVSHLEKTFGVHYAIGGVEAIAKAMVRVIEEQRGRVHMDAEVDEIITQDHKTIGVRLKNDRLVHADIVVSNADPGHTYRHLLRHHKRSRWTNTRIAKSRWSMGLFVWYFGTRGTRDLWPDVGHHTILNGPRFQSLVRDIFVRGKLADDMSLYVHRPSVTDPGVAPDGGDTFYALSPVPHLGHEDPVDWSSIAETYRDRVQNVLEQQLLPGLGKYLSASKVFTPETFRDRYLSPYGAGFSIEPRILQSAWFRPHNVSEEAKGLYLVGAGTHPGAGLPGVISSAEVLSKLVPDASMAGVK